MNRIEIKMSKRTYWTIVIFFTILSLTTLYLVYLTDLMADKVLSKYLALPINIGMLYYTYRLTSKLLANEPEIVLTNDFLEIRDFNEIQRKGKLAHYKWDNIKDIKIEKIKSKSSLTILTDSETTNFNISGLEKTPDELNGIIKRFR